MGQIFLFLAVTRVTNIIVHILAIAEGRGFWEPIRDTVAETHMAKVFSMTWMRREKIEGLVETERERNHVQQIDVPGWRNTSTWRDFVKNDARWGAD